MPEHLVPLGMLVVVTSLLCFAARRAPGPWLDWAAVIIALAIVLAELSWQPYVLANHSWSAAFSLPVQLCDVGASSQPPRSSGVSSCWSRSPTSGGWVA